MSKKLILAFILGLILFLSWGHPAFATTLVPVRPPIVNPNIAPAPLFRSMPSPLKTNSTTTNRVPFFSLPVASPEPQTCVSPYAKLDKLRVLKVDMRRPEMAALGQQLNSTHYAVRGIVPDLPQLEMNQYLTQVSNHNIVGLSGWYFDYDCYCQRFYIPLPGDVYVYETWIESYFDWRYGWVSGAVIHSSLSRMGQYIRYPHTGTAGYDSTITITVLNPPCEEEEEKKCDNSSFFKCAGNAFSSHFPFDIFTSLPDDRELVCPEFNFFGKVFDLCWLYSMVRVFKYPIILGFLVRIALKL